MLDQLKVPYTIPDVSFSWLTIRPDGITGKGDRTPTGQRRPRRHRDSEREGACVLLSHPIRLVTVVAHVEVTVHPKCGFARSYHMVSCLLWGHRDAKRSTQT